MNVQALKAEEFHKVYTEAFNSGDVEAVVSLYEPDARFVPEPGEVAAGRAAIRETLAAYQGIGAMRGGTSYCITAGDVALASARWEITGTTPDGEPAHAEGLSADLLRRQADGRWLLVVDNPFGGGRP